MFLVEVIRKEQDPFVLPDIFRSIESAKKGADNHFTVRNKTAVRFHIYEVGDNGCQMVLKGEMEGIAWTRII